jgi:hypothetical protein
MTDLDYVTLETKLAVAQLTTAVYLIFNNNQIHLTTRAGFINISCTTIIPQVKPMQFYFRR